MRDREADKSAPLAEAGTSQVPAREQELPVVARIVVEVRSDGTRTVARGAMEDAASQTRVAIEASGGTPLELATALAKSIFAAPWLPRRAPLDALRGLLNKKRG